MISFLIIFSIRGLLRGLIKEGFSLVGFFGGIVVGINYNELVYKVFRDFHIENPIMHRVVGFFAIFIAFVFVTYILGEIMHRLFRALALSTIDRLLGFAVGAVEGFLLGGFTIFILSKIPVLQELVTGGEIARFVLSLFGEVLKKV